MNDEWDNLQNFGRVEGFYHALMNNQCFDILKPGIILEFVDLAHNFGLVGGWPIPLKNMKVNGKDDIPYMKMENKTCLKPPTSGGIKQHNEWVSQKLCRKCCRFLRRKRFSWQDFVFIGFWSRSFYPNSPGSRLLDLCARICMYPVGIRVWICISRPIYGIGIIYRKN